MHYSCGRTGLDKEEKIHGMCIYNQSCLECKIWLRLDGLGCDEVVSLFSHAIAAGRRSILTCRE